MRPLLITGAHGQLGRALLAAAAARGLPAVGVDVDTLDLRERAAVLATVAAIAPRAVVNCAAFTAVDACEEHEDEARAVNATAVGHLAAACDAADATLVQISTDYVFDGTGRRPYREDDAPRPLGAYGRTKLEGETQARAARRHLIVRTSWLFGTGGANFVTAIRGQLAGGREVLRVVADQRGCPTYAGDLADALLDLLEAGAAGVVHAVNHGETTWHGLAQEIVRQSGARAEVVAVATADVPRAAPRPAYSVLDTGHLASLLGRTLPPWQQGLARYLAAPCAS